MLRTALWWALGALVLCTGLASALVLRDTGTIRYHGNTFRIPLPPGNIKIASSDGHASYVTTGYPHLAQIFTARGAPFGWGPGDQMGGGITIRSTTNEKLWLVVIIEQRTRFFTQFNFRVDESPAHP